MKRVISLIPVMVILLFVFSSGCTGSSGTVPPTTEATPLPTAVATSAPAITATRSPAPIVVPTTEPIQIIPEEQLVNLVLSKDRPTSEIHLQYQGGPGERFTNKVIMRVYSSDGKYTEYVMSDGKKPLPGDEIVAPGTKGIDRCEVFVISAGIRYKVMDEPALGGGYY